LHVSDISASFLRTSISSNTSGYFFVTHSQHSVGLHRMER
jgi:hypothetical protein